MGQQDRQEALDEFWLRYNLLFELRLFSKTLRLFHECVHMHLLDEPIVVLPLGYDCLVGQSDVLG